MACEPALRVEHTPDLPDRSHSEVFGDKTAAVRIALLAQFQWEIKPDAAVEA